MSGPARRFDLDGIRSTLAQGDRTQFWSSVEELLDESAFPAKALTAAAFGLALVLTAYTARRISRHPQP